MRQANDPLHETVLTAGSAGESAPAVLRWIRVLAATIRNQLDVSTTTVNIRAYRDPETSLGVDLIDGEDACYSMTIRALGQMVLDDAEPIVTDLAEAVHIAGLLSRELDRPVKIW